MRKKPYKFTKVKPVNISPKLNLWFGCTKISNSTIKINRGSVFYYDGLNRFETLPPSSESIGFQYFIPEEIVEIPEDLRGGFRIYCKIYRASYNGGVLPTILADQYGATSIDDNYSFFDAIFGFYTAIRSLNMPDNDEELPDGVYSYEVFSNSFNLPAKSDDENAAGTEWVYIPICEGQVVNSVLSFKQIFNGVFIINRGHYYYSKYYESF